MRTRTLADLTKAEAEVARLTAIIKANGIDPLTGKLNEQAPAKNSESFEAPLKVKGIQVIQVQ